MRLPEGERRDDALRVGCKYVGELERAAATIFDVDRRGHPRRPRSPQESAIVEKGVGIEDYPYSRLGVVSGCLFYYGMCRGKHAGPVATGLRLSRSALKTAK